ncbi:Uncharacterised protein [Mycobacteroides abscessus subsp. bolletii]|uniref:hypothetical protein n=1 Tax=Mycobacteroides abscessus TaxID=36809 RepID=UPI0009CF7A53|nr:hypothetical protein [Mycobacteroides abscessus]SKZ03345.1 Uncharacterised protein [Mycobacteroides abscessus subsp. bolletii]
MTAASIHPSTARKVPAAKLRSVPRPAPEPIRNAETRWETDPEELGREVLALVHHVHDNMNGPALLEETRRWVAQFPDKAAQHLLVLCAWFDTTDTTVALENRAAQVLGENEAAS